MIMNGGIILFDHEPRILKYSVKPGRIALARFSTNGQKKKKRRMSLLILLSVNPPLLRFSNQKRHLKPQ
jgi:hypothetical protein